MAASATATTATTATAARYTGTTGGNTQDTTVMLVRKKISASRSTNIKGNTTRFSRRKISGITKAKSKTENVLTRRLRTENARSREKVTIQRDKIPTQSAATKKLKPKLTSSNFKTSQALPKVESISRMETNNGRKYNKMIGTIDLNPERTYNRSRKTHLKKKKPLVKQKSNIPSSKGEKMSKPLRTSEDSLSSPQTSNDISHSSLGRQNILTEQQERNQIKIINGSPITKRPQVLKSSKRPLIPRRKRVQKVSKDKNIETSHSFATTVSPMTAISLSSNTTSIPEVSTQEKFSSLFLTTEISTKSFGGEKQLFKKEIVPRRASKSKTRPQTLLSRKEVSSTKSTTSSTSLTSVKNSKNLSEPVNLIVNTNLTNQRKKYTFKRLQSKSPSYDKLEYIDNSSVTNQFPTPATSVNKNKAEEYNIRENKPG